MATPRGSGPTDGYAGAFIAHQAGRPWLPWQRYAADVIGEQTSTGAYRYRTVVVTVPRQCGKTTWALDVAIGRAIVNRDYRAAYAAQTGHVTTERMTDRFTEISTGPMARRLLVRRSQGTEKISAPAGSYVKAFPPLPGALRSSALDLVIVDEAQEHGMTLGEQLDSGIQPVFSTRRRQQLIIIGTAGTDASDYLRRHLANARAGAEGYAVFEWGFSDEDDPEDETTWTRTHPGVGRLTELDSLRTARVVMGAAGFAREYGNRWSRSSDRVIDGAAWAACQLAPGAPRPQGPVCFSLDVAPDRGSAAIAISVPPDTTRPAYVEVVDVGPGVEWLVDRCLERFAVYGAPFAVDRYGAAGPTVDALERAGVPLLVMKAGDVANAAAGFLDAVTSHALDVYPSPDLTDAVDGAAQRTIADTGGFAWSRKAAAAPVPPLVAASHALWGALHLTPEVRPVAAAL